MGLMTMCANCGNTEAMAARSPHHHVSSEGNCNFSPSKASLNAGKKPSKAGDSKNAEPGALATTTWPARTACSKPGMPKVESARNSSGSKNSSSKRLSNTCTGSKPRKVRKYKRSSRTVRSLPSTKLKPK